VKLIKAIILAATMLLPVAAFAITDEERMELAGAMEKGDAAYVKQLLDSGMDPNEKAYAWSYLQVAANKNQLAIVKLMVERGADVNYKHPITKMTSIALAAYNGNKDMVQYLISKGGDPNIKLRGDVSIVRMARDMGKADMAEFLMQNGAKDDGCKEEKCF
jgi:ankyrin repeat protein